MCRTLHAFCELPAISLTSQDVDLVYMRTLLPDNLPKPLGILTNEHHPPIKKLGGERIFQKSSFHASSAKNMLHLPKMKL